jgi:hypothetical protein
MGSSTKCLFLLAFYRVTQDLDGNLTSRTQRNQSIRISHIVLVLIGATIPFAPPWLLAGSVQAQTGTF